ncbi:hypothetical protein BDI4_540006 [Burkholderia diffusa]|nr:hypothetical protein BDI4_540006 [Burkholderia diffusa]
MHLSHLPSANAPSRQLFNNFLFATIYQLQFAPQRQLSTNDCEPTLTPTTHYNFPENRQSKLLSHNIQKILNPSRVDRSIHKSARQYSSNAVQAALTASDFEFCVASAAPSLMTEKATSPVSGPISTLHQTHPDGSDARKLTRSSR